MSAALLIKDFTIKYFDYRMYLLTILMSLIERKKSLNFRTITSERKYKMANIKSAKKRVLIAEANRQRNVAFKTSIKTAIKKALALAAESDKDALNAAISNVYKLCDKAVSKGMLHKNTAARKKSRLVLAIKKLEK